MSLSHEGSSKFGDEGRQSAPTGSHGAQSLVGVTLLRDLRKRKKAFDSTQCLSYAEANRQEEKTCSCCNRSLRGRDEDV